MSACAQISPGEIAIIGINGDGNDSFTWIVLTDIAGSQEIYFTEEGWGNGSWIGSGETHMLYTAPAGGLSCGDIIHCEESPSDVFTCSQGTLVLALGTGYSNTGDDQILAYLSTTGPAPAVPNFIAGIHTDYSPSNYDAGTTWSDATGTGPLRSMEPLGLTNAVNCLSIFPAPGPELDNSKYTGPLSGASASVLADIMNLANWSSDDVTPYPIAPGDYPVPSISCLPPPPDWCWAKEVLGSSHEEFLDLATDPVSGESYAVGYFQGNLSTVYITGLNGTPDMTSPLGIQDGLVAKYDALGNELYAFKIGGAGAIATVTGVEISASGNFYVCGYFTGTCNFQGVTTSTSSVQVAIGEDAFVACYDSNGNLQWVNKGQSLGEDRALDLAVNSTMVYTVGWFQNTITWDGAPGLSANDSRDTYLVAYDHSGAYQWTGHAGDNDPGFSVNDRGYAVAADDNDVYITGTFTRTTEFDGGPTQVGALSPGNRNIFLAEFDASLGGVTWADVIGATGGSGSAEAHGLAIDANFLFVAGGVDGNVTFPGGSNIPFGSGEEEIFACGILRSSKIMNWVVSAINDVANPVIAEDIISDGADNVYVTGRYEGTTNFDGGADARTSFGAGDLFVMALKDAGTYLWTKVATDATGVFGFGLGYDDSGGVYVAGSMNAGATMAPLLPLGDAGGQDALIAKIECTTPCNGPVITTCQSDVTVTADPTCNHTLGDYTSGMIVVNDACGTGSITVTQDPVAGTVLPAGTHTIDLIARDGNGDDDTCSFDIVIEADVNPTVVNCGDLLIGESTFGGGFNGGPFACGGGTTDLGEDVYYQITVPTGNYLLGVEMTNVSDVNDGFANVFWVGGACPLGSGCLFSDQFDITDQDFDSNNQSQLLFNAVGPGTYYFVVDSETDGIDLYDIEFSCVVSGVEFDETGCGLDTDNDGLYVEVNGSATLDVEPCESVSVCHTIYVQNILGGEWMDTVVFDLGPCYTNVTNMVPNGPGANGSYDLSGTWNAIYDGPSNSIEWGFDNSTGNEWGDGQFPMTNYNCNVYTFCFDADIAAGCSSAGDLEIDILIEDDGVDGAIPGVAPGFDYATSDGFTLTVPDPSFAYGSSAYCQGDTDPAASITGTGGGTFSSTPGLVILNTSTGLLDVSASTTGTYTVTYSVGLCPETATFNVTINAEDDPSFNYASATYCATGTDPTANVTGTGGGTFSEGSGNVVFVNTATGEIDLSASTIGGPYNIVYTTPGPDCPNSTTFAITITPPPDAGTNGTHDFCTTDPAANLFADLGGTPQSGGAWTGPLPPLTGGDAGTFTPGINVAGTYTYTVTAAGCAPATADVVVTVSNPPTTSNAGPNQLICSGNAAVFAGNTPTSGTGTWTLSSGAGVPTTPNDPNSPVTGLGPGFNTFTWTISNGCGSSSDNVNINLDQTNPTINCPANFNVNANASCAFTIPDYTGLATGSDNCGWANSTVTQSPLVGTSVGLGFTVITLTATDQQGNSSSCNFTITVVDATAPSIVGCPANITVGNDPGACAATVSWTSPTATDNCAGVGIAQTSGLASGSSFPLGTSTIEYTATDGAGNTSVCSFTITVNDTEDPFAGCFGDVNVNAAPGSCDATATWSAPTYSDNCPGGGIVQTGGPASGSTFPIGSTLITYTATDAAGNTSICSFNVIVSDAESPVITGCPVDFSVSNDLGGCAAVVSWPAPGFTDNCAGGSITQTGGPANGTSFPVGTTAVTYTATDAAGNTDFCAFNVTVTDNEAPALVCPTDQNENVNASCEFDLLDYTGLATATDNCTATPSIVLTQSPVPGTTVSTNTVVTLMADDGNGNTSTCNFNVILNDVDPPVLTCPPDMTEYVDASCDFSIPDYTGSLGVSDNCDASPVVVQSPPAGTVISGDGTTQVITFTVTDASSNSSNCSFTITLEDTVSPTITCPGDQTETPGPGCVFVLPDYTSMVVSADNCGTVSVTQFPGPSATISSNTTITMTADDGNGNTSTCQFEVILADIIAPTIACPNDTIVNNDPGICGANLSLPVPLASDNCSVTSVLNDFNGTGDASDLYPLGTTTVLWTVTDGSSNTNTCSVDVTVVDVEAPVISCPANAVVNAAPGSCDATYTFLISDTDNCASTLSQIGGLPSGSVFPAGMTVNTFVSEDPSGNTDTCTFTVTVVDNENPTILCPSDEHECDTNFTIDLPIVSDNCMILSVVNDFNGTGDASGTYPYGVTSITWTVTDTAGNMSSCISTVTADEVPWPVDAGPDQTLDFSFETNLNATPPSVGTGTWSNGSGMGYIWDDLDPYSYVDNLGVGENSFIWTVVNGVCPPVSDEVIIFVNDFAIPQAVTPNGDGQNDLFVVNGMQNLENRIEIFNRWGQQVFEQANYQNDWDGTNMDGEALANDTYFYVITIESETYNGYVVVRR